MNQPIPPAGVTINSATTKEMIAAKLAQLQAKGTRRAGTQLPTKDDRQVRGIIPGTTTRIRILPGKIYQSQDGQFHQEPWFTETAIHRLKGPNTNFFIDCPKTVSREPCPICRYIGNLWNSQSEVNIALAREIKARAKYYLNVIQRNRQYLNENGQPSVESSSQYPLILSCGPKLFQRILFLCSRVGDLTLLQGGHDFEIICTQQGEWYNYDMSDVVHEVSDAGTDEWIAYWMNNLNDINSIISRPSQDEIVKQLSEFLEDKLRSGSQAVESLPMPDSGIQIPAVQGMSFQTPPGVQPSLPQSGFSSQLQPTMVTPPPQSTGFQTNLPPVQYPGFSVKNEGTSYTPPIPPVDLSADEDDNNLPWKSDPPSQLVPPPTEQPAPVQQTAPTPPPTEQPAPVQQTAPTPTPPPTAGKPENGSGNASMSFLEKLKQSQAKAAAGGKA